MKIRSISAPAVVAILLVTVGPPSIAQEGSGQARVAQANQAQLSGNGGDAASAAHAPAISRVKAPPLPAGSQSLQPGIGEAPDVKKRGRHAHRDPAYNKKDLTRDDTLVTPAVVPGVGKN